MAHVRENRRELIAHDPSVYGDEVRFGVPAGWKSVVRERFSKGHLEGIPSFGAWPTDDVPGPQLLELGF